MSRTRLLGLLLAIGLLAALGAAGGGWVVFSSTTPDYEGTRTVTLPDSTADSLAAVTDALVARGILQRPAVFRWVAQATGWGAQIKPGHYAFGSGASTYDVLSTLRRGLQTPVRLTIPPGSRPSVVAAVAARDLRLSKRDFLAALQDSSLARTVGVAPGTLFGYLLPETFEFYWQTPPERVLRRIKEGFDRFYAREIAPHTDSLGLSKREVVTLASIVEWEALLDEEKPTIAGVYLNRLENGWKLQADPTVQYVLIDTQGARVGRVLYKHLEIDHPYNTYQIVGLPPGPITNPAPSTLRAVAQAEDHRYFYFAADGTGGHAFSRTLREHNRAAEAYHRLLDQRERQQRQ
jgi:UPF0755 protein